MDNELWEVLQSFKAAIDMCLQHVQELDEQYGNYKSETDKRIQSLESTLYDEIINPTQEYIDETNRNARFDDFNSKYGEKLGSYNDALRSLEGDDFDLTQSAFDKYDSYEGEDKPSEEAFVQALINEVGSQLDAIKRGLGLPADADVAVKETGDGETVVEVEDENGTEIVASDNEPVNMDEEATDEEPEDDPEEVAAFEEELKNQK